MERDMMTVILDVKYVKVRGDRAFYHEEYDEGMVNMTPHAWMDPNMAEVKREVIYGNPIYIPGVGACYLGMTEKSKKQIGDLVQILEDLSCINTDLSNERHQLTGSIAENKAQKHFLDQQLKKMSHRRRFQTLKAMNG